MLFRITDAILRASVDNPLLASMTQHNIVPRHFGRRGVKFGSGSDQPARGFLDVKLFFNARDASHALISQKSFTFARCGKHVSGGLRGRRLSGLR